mgnify:FL=1
MLTKYSLLRIAFIFGLSSVANASLITFNYEGNITRTELLGVTVGDRLYGSYTFDTSINDSQPTKSTAVYQFTSPETIMTLNYGTVALQSDNFSIVILDSDTSVDIYRAQMQVSGILYALSFIAVDPSVITNRDLLLSPPNISTFNQAQFSANNDNSVINLTTRGEITSISSVPLPPSVWLFISGIFALFTTNNITKNPAGSLKK